MSWIERAKVGDRVVCIDTWHLENGCGYGDEVGPISNEIYTIRDIGICPECGGVVIRLAEIYNPVRAYGGYLGWEPNFAIERFRPVRDTTTQVEAIIRAALDVPANTPEAVQ